MISATGVRIGWADLPAHVRTAVEAMLGDTVVSAASQPGGFSPGTADRVRTATGRRAFVKAVSPAQNEYSPVMHRREARISAGLPAGAPVPTLIGSYDDGDWVVLVLDDVEGRHPRTPWDPAELASVRSTLTSLAAALTPSPLRDVPTAAAQFGHDFAGWQRLADDPHPALDAWATAHLPDLCAASRRGLDALAGDTLVHCDVRADNLLLRPDSSVVLVDWPWASLGPDWFDTVLLALNVRLYGGDGESILTDLDVHPGTVTDVLVGLCGFFLDVARQPPMPNLPTVRAFQQAQGDVLLPWLRARISLRGT